MTQRITAQQIATAHAVLKSYGYFVDHSVLEEAMQTALCSRARAAQNELAAASSRAGRIWAGCTSGTDSETRKGPSTICGCWSKGQ